MAKATKVSSDDESDHACDSDNDEPTKDELFTMLEYYTQHYKKLETSARPCLRIRKPLCKNLMRLELLMRV